MIGTGPFAFGYLPPPPVFSSAGCDIEISRVVITQFCNTLNGPAAEGR